METNNYYYGGNNLIQKVRQASDGAEPAMVLDLIQTDRKDAIARQFFGLLKDPIPDQTEKMQ